MACMAGKSFRDGLGHCRLSRCHVEGFMLRGVAGIMAVKARAASFVQAVGESAGFMPYLLKPDDTGFRQL